MIRKSYNRTLDNILYKFIGNDSCEFIIMEGIDEIKKFFPKLSEEQLKKLISLDPTYRGGDQLGKYGQWIIKLFYNELKNIERQRSYNEFIKQHPDGINPKNGNKINPPQFLPSLKKEDFYKVKETLTEYDKLKKQIGKSLDKFSTLGEVDEAIAQVKNSGLPTDKTALERYKTFKECEKKGLEKVYEDSKWIVGIPTTLESSVPFGEYTSWCTTSAHGSYYRGYTKQGPLYILLDKTTGELFQFHYESMSFMNEHDRRIKMDDFTEEEPNLCKHLFDIKLESKKVELPPVKNRLIEAKKTVKELLDNVSDKRLWMTYIQDFKNINVEGDNIFIDINIEAIKDVYAEGNDGISFKWLCDFLEDPFESLNIYSDYSESELESYGDTIFDRTAREMGINITLEELFNYWRKSDEPNKITSLIDDDWCDGNSIFTCIRWSIENGTTAEAENDIIGQLKNQLPIVEILDSTSFRLKLSIENLYYIVYCIENGPDHLDDSIGKYSDPVQQDLELNDSQNDIKFDDYWYGNWSQDYNDHEDDPWYYSEEYEYNWLYLYRSTIDRDPWVAVDEPYYGWSGFDDDEWKNYAEVGLKKLKEILGDKSLEEYSESEE